MSTRDVVKVEVVEGIVGGFVGPTIRLYVVIAPADDDPSVIEVRYDRLKPGTTEEYIEARGTTTTEEFKRLADSINYVWDLPIEEPRDSEDIYGLDTALKLYTRDGEEWYNGAPAGCVHGMSTIRPTAAESAAFREALTEVLEFARSKTSAS
eukprot:Colp12_sorted_trinity150504_noHs@2698